MSDQDDAVFLWGIGALFVGALGAACVIAHRSTPDFYAGLTVATKRDPALWARVKAEAVEQLGGRWSARAAQLATQKYKAAGGRYVGPKPSARENKLAKWTKEEWTTRPGTPKKAERGGVMHRYLPRKRWQKLSKAEQLATDRKKVEGSLRGEQYVPNTRAARATKS